MDAVFKLLHVEVARKATDGELKKNEERKKFGFSFTVCKTEENSDKINLFRCTEEKKMDKYFFVSPVENK